MLRVRRRLWTPANIRHLPTAYRFLTPGSNGPLAAKATNGDSDSTPIELPPPPPTPSDPGYVQAVAGDLTPSSQDDIKTATSSSVIIERIAPPPPNKPLSENTGSHSAPVPQLSEDVSRKLHEWSEQARSRLHTQTLQWTNSAAARFSRLGGELNQITGYGEIEQLKKLVASQEASISLARTAAREAKAAHDEAVLQRAQSQREVNDLLSRKSSWSDDDVGRFTRLVRQDHLYEQAEARAKEAATKAEDEVEREFTALMQAILNRYHEEQVWSDKIRSASTYGSLAVLGLNVLVFLMATIFVEPWKRKRLAATFGKKVDEMDARNTLAIGDGMTAIHRRLDRQEEAFAQLMAMAVQPPPIPIAASPEPAPEPAEPEETHEQILPIAGPTSIASTRPWSWSWEDWRAKLTQPDTRDVLLAASSLAFVGGSMAGWIIRELRR